MPTSSISLPPLHRGLEMREQAALRAAGRLGLLTVPLAHRLICADRGDDSALVLLRRVVERRLLVRLPLPRAPQSGGNRPPAKTHDGYMLTPEGRDLLASLGGDPPEALARLVVRDRKAEPLTDAQGTLQRFYAGYCAAIIAEDAPGGESLRGGTLPAGLQHRWRERGDRADDRGGGNAQGRLR